MEGPGLHPLRKQHPYNTSLFAAMIAKDGPEKTEKYLTDLKANLARTAGGGDRDVARDIPGRHL